LFLDSIEVRKKERNQRDVDFTIILSFPFDGWMMVSRDGRYWGRLYIEGWPSPIQYFKAHFGLSSPPIGIDRFVR